MLLSLLCSALSLLSPDLDNALRQLCLMVQQSLRPQPHAPNLPTAATLSLSLRHSRRRPRNLEPPHRHTLSPEPLRLCIPHRGAVGVEPYPSGGRRRCDGLGVRAAEGEAVGHLARDRALAVPT